MYLKIWPSNECLLPCIDDCCFHSCLCFLPFLYFLLKEAKQHLTSKPSLFLCVTAAHVTINIERLVENEQDTVTMISRIICIRANPLNYRFP